MSPLPIILPISELRQNAAGVIKRATASGRPVFVTQHGRATAVLVDAVSYAQTHEELALLHRLMQAEEEIRTGQTVSLSDALEQADAFLAEDDAPGSG
jgi:prevent-host-death family protein